VTDQQAALDWLHERYFKPKEEPKPKKPKGSGPELTLGDQEIIDRARAARNGAKFATLFYGSWEAAGYPSQSEADAALCSLLAFWARDEGQIDRIFRQSALMREKWDEQHHADGRTYGQATIERALSTVAETYRPGDHREKPSP
jgi:putative DNA primase/helicase